VHRMRDERARIYDYWLGGKDNYTVDREAAEQAIAANPGIVADVRANRRSWPCGVPEVVLACELHRCAGRARRT
jgi:hypothetical protein